MYYRQILYAAKTVEIRVLVVAYMQQKCGNYYITSNYSADFTNNLTVLTHNCSSYMVV